MLPIKINIDKVYFSRFNNFDHDKNVTYFYNFLGFLDSIYNIKPYFKKLKIKDSIISNYYLTFYENGVKNKILYGWK
jgi:vacuolar-type H+-ATPase subunit C/Vma6